MKSIALLLLASTAFAQQPDAALGRLEREIARLAPLSGGQVGVAAVHLESGRAVYLNRGERFPMASSYKVPIAYQLMTRVDRGEVRLDSMITLKPGDLHPGSGTLTELLDDPGVILSVRNLLELMLLISDNTATDIMLRTAGGAQAVTQRLRTIGVDGISVDRATLNLIADWAGWRLPSGSDDWRAAARPTKAGADSAARAFDRDARDTATPEAMALLLQKIWRSDGLSSQSSALLVDIMTRSTTGAERLKGLLPPKTAVAHKTGTIGGTTNDVGIITLPEDAGHVIAVVFVKESTLPVETRERAIAQIARSIYDYFLFMR
ncbi:MAG: class A beta-lactamase [Gemmatimonadaceae bacterium]